jgi:hypothetical protein
VHETVDAGLFLKRRIKFLCNSDFSVSTALPSFLNGAANVAALNTAFLAAHPTSFSHVLAYVQMQVPFVKVQT